MRQRAPAAMQKSHRLTIENNRHIIVHSVAGCVQFDPWRCGNHVLPQCPLNGETLLILITCAALSWVTSQDCAWPPIPAGDAPDGHSPTITR